MGALQFNPKTMPLRKNRSPKWGTANSCQIRKFCFMSLAVGAAMVALVLYADQQMVRNLYETTPSPLIRRPVKYLTKLALDGTTTPSPSEDIDSIIAIQNDQDKKDQGMSSTTTVETDASKSEKFPNEPKDHSESELNDIEANQASQTMIKEDESSTLESPTVVIEQTVESPADSSSAEKSEGNTSVEMKTKPRLFLHVGPQKTGSSTLQSALDIMSRLTYHLDQDNLTYRHITPEEGDFDCELGPWGGFINCVVSEKLKKLISETRDAGHNLLLTDENLGDRFVAPLRAAISDDEWDVTVIVMYRRVHEWLVSWYNQINKTTNLDSDGNILVDENGIPYREEHKHWPGKGGAYVPEFSSWYKDYIKDWDPSELPSKHRSVEYYKLYYETFRDVVVLNMHEGGDFVTSFFCDIIQASHSCQRLREKEIDLSEVNASVNLDHDILATFFYDQDLVDKALDRKEVVAAITQFISDSGNTIPRSCDASVIDQIFYWLVASEKIMMEGRWTEASEEELKKVFQAYMNEGKLCDLDKEAVLRDEHWRTFFDALTKSQKRSEGNLVLTSEIQESMIGDQKFFEESYQISPQLYLLIHIGTSVSELKSIGSVLDAMDEAGHGLKQDGYEHLSIDPFDGYFECAGDDRHIEDEACEATEKFASLLETMETNGKNLYLIIETLDGRLPSALEKAIDHEKWHTTVVVTYTRLHDLLYEIYASYAIHPNQGEDEAWPEDGGRTIPSFTSWYSGYTRGWETTKIEDFHLSTHLLSRYASAFNEVFMDDPYEDSNPIQRFVCGSIPKAVRTCNSFNDASSIIATVESDNRLHDAVAVIEADILAVSAWQQGLLRNGLLRHTVVGAIQQRIESEGGSALPRTCNVDMTEQLHELVIESEKVALGSNWRPKRITRISADFEDFLKAGKLCDVDLDKALHDDDWVEFFQSL
ncbi:hypothetical protein IV203_037317 [Nitzschia inconspicua]|uniref:Sulfotransferase domain-containing protein n=1 Tax=Nitzschia inconspicua TaxID=303405 RepID=A0A9K3LKH0_9STRA|nr:hypothetical protein IV203_006351 [Nitzschia inconspicua]KAG7364115.1 hypothetical protein IV203_037317 [Nitzschia inconspicua]